VIRLSIEIERDERLFHYSHRLPLEELMSAEDREEYLKNLVNILVYETLQYVEETANG
jgi:hypothetical protein